MAVISVTVNGSACNSKNIPKLPQKAVTQTRKGKSFLPKTVGTNPISRSRWEPLHRPSSEDTVHVLSSSPSAGPRNLCQGLQTLKWTDFSVPLPAFKFVHNLSLELGYLDTRLGIGEEPVQILLGIGEQPAHILLHHLLTGPGGE